MHRHNEVALFLFLIDIKVPTVILDLFVSISLYHTFFCPSNPGSRQLIRKCVDENAQTNPTENEKSTSAQSAGNAANQEIFEYIGNANTKKFHYPDCGAVPQMKEKNKFYLNCTRDEAIKDGYTPCGRCNP